MNITVKKWEVLYFFKVKSLDGSLKKTIHLFQEFLKIFFDTSMYHKIEKGKLAERQGRKAMDLRTDVYDRQVADFCVVS